MKTPNLFNQIAFAKTVKALLPYQYMKPRGLLLQANGSAVNSWCRRYTHVMSFKRYLHNNQEPLLRHALILPKHNQVGQALQSQLPQFRTLSSSKAIPTKPSLVTQKIDTPEFHSLFTPELQTFIDIFKKHGYEVRIVGGAVRDLLIDKVPADLDFATTATPAQMKKMFLAEGIRVGSDQRGEAHGNVTPRINEKKFEVTTLRIDVVTDGRHAEVEFTTDWMLDASRRDLTVNSLYLGFDGTVYDYFNGIQDIKNRRLSFIGDPQQRIEEDYLRILRYLRFYGNLATDPNTHDINILDAIKKHSSGLQGVTALRLWKEMKQILLCRMAAEVLGTMMELGVAQALGFSNNCDPLELHKVCRQTEHSDSKSRHIIRLSVLLKDEDNAHAVHKRYGLSNADLSTVLFIIKHRGTDIGRDLITFCTDLFVDTCVENNWHEKNQKNKTQFKKQLMQNIRCLMEYSGQAEAGEKFFNSKSEMPRFPVKGQDLSQMGVPKSEVNETLKGLWQKWKDSRYNLDKDMLLGSLSGVSQISD